jgi:hypothetical protein
MHDEMAFCRRGFGHCKIQAQCARDLLAGGIDIDERQIDIRNCPPAQVADQCADDTHANDRDAIAAFGAGIPHGIKCGLHIGGEYRTSRR